jgi:xanthine dehydrogenase accessory factor
MANETILNVLQAAVSALESGQRAVLLTVVNAAGSTPRRNGAKMLLREDGSVVGTIGGGTMEERAVIDARAALESGVSTTNRYQMGGRLDQSVGLCGGQMDVSIEVLTPAARLLIIGAGHIAHALAALAAIAGMDVIIVDDRPQWATKERFPGARELHVVAYDRVSEALAPIPVTITPSTAVVLATWGWDEPALQQVLATPSFYIGLVGSRRKLKLISAGLAAKGFDPATIARVRAPAGLDLGGETPAEIAVSILAEILMLRYGAGGQPLHDQRHGSTSQ